MQAKESSWQGFKGKSKKAEWKLQIAELADWEPILGYQNLHSAFCNLNLT
jgi:hypothetical protein